MWERQRTDLAPAVADALFWFSDPAAVVMAEDKPSLLGDHGLHLCGEAGLAGYVTQILGVVGDEDPVELLCGFVDDPALGTAAIESVKRLTGETA